MTNSERVKQRYHEDPEFRARRRAASKRYYERIKDTEEFRKKNYQRVAEWREANPEKVKAMSKSPSRREYSRKYYAAHKDKIKPYTPTPEQKAKYKARAKAVMDMAKRILADPKYAATVPEDVKSKVLNSYNRRIEYQRKYYADNRERMLKACNQRRADNVELYRQRAREGYHRRKIMAQRAKSRVN
jgi:hypothetical protein